MVGTAAFLYSEYIRGSGTLYKVQMTTLRSDPLHSARPRPAVGQAHRLGRVNETLITAEVPVCRQLEVTKRSVGEQWRDRSLEPYLGLTAWGDKI